ncbi:penicillin-insensitive murein endopeptidase [Bacteriovoracaceae bacterium]|nr:penicillin-insensitive murein endopeptidase [Bacteriovoracaceae bacterium]
MKLSIIFSCQIFILFLILFVNLSFADEVRSTCFGSTKKGSLKNGVKLPRRGKNFKSYSWIAGIVGRTYVHSAVKEIMIDAYAELARTHPDIVYKYAETGFEEGGRFKPHKTHQNGLSVDHMVPVKKNDKSVHLPTNAFNKLGYAIEFNLEGKYKDYHLDYEALGALIKEIHRQAVAKGYEIWRVIFDPRMSPNLFKTSHGKYLKKNIRFSKNKSWVRHDEHIHIDFRVPCQ